MTLVIKSKNTGEAPFTVGDNYIRMRMRREWDWTPEEEARLLAGEMVSTHTPNANYVHRYRLLARIRESEMP